MLPRGPEHGEGQDALGMSASTEHLGTKGGDGGTHIYIMLTLG